MTFTLRTKWFRGVRVQIKIRKCHGGMCVDPFDEWTCKRFALGDDRVAGSLDNGNKF